MLQDKEIADILLKIKAVNLNIKQPFTYSSGIISPIYTDNRLIISFPEHRERIIAAFLKCIRQHSIKFDIIAGAATGGIPWAAWLAEHLKRPMIYVRNNKKSHGRQNVIEGHFESGDTVLIIEDLISTGKSAISVAEALRNHGATAQQCLSIFSYEFPNTQKSFAAKRLDYFSLCDFNVLIQQATDLGIISNEEKLDALQWNKSPENWHR